MTSENARDNKARDPHWDNIRYVSGTLVVFGHLTDTLTDRDGLRWLQLATWALRVPVFVMVAGYFSSADPLRPREARRLVESVLAPYVLVGLLHSVQQWWFSRDFDVQVAQPHWAMWFLLSLLCWRAGLPYLLLLRRPLTASVVTALAAGYVRDVGPALSLSRTLCFLPFFLLGWYLRQGRLAGTLRARWSRWAALAVLAATAVAAWVWRHDVAFAWLRMSRGYDGTYDTAWPWDWTTRAGVLAIGTAAALSFVRLIPRRRLPLVTALGGSGLYVYLLHPLVLRPFLRWVGVDWVGPWYEQALMPVCAVALVPLLASEPVRRLTRPVVQPRLDWLFEAAPPRPGAPAARPPG